MSRPVIVPAALVALLLGGCDLSVEQAELDLQVTQRAEAARAGLTLERAQEIVANVTGVEASNVTIMHRSLAEGTAMILAAVPAAEGMLYEEARRPNIPDSLTEQTIEAIDLRWDLEADLPILVLWSERLQFAENEPVTDESAEAVARQLLERWVPEQAGEVAEVTVQKIQAPMYVVNWQGAVDGVFTGDRAVVNVSSVTGLPISFSQRLAAKRPSPDVVRVTRDQALAAVRKHLVANEAPGGDDIPLVAQLTLSAEEHPTNGPAWLVAAIGESGLQRQVLLVDAITGRVMSTIMSSGEGFARQEQ